MAATGTELALPRLLRGCADREMTALDRHLAVHGPIPGPRQLDAAALIGAIEKAGLRGRGGAAFPAAHKLHAKSGGKPILSDKADVVLAYLATPEGQSGFKSLGIFHQAKIDFGSPPSGEK